MRPNIETQPENTSHNGAIVLLTDYYQNYQKQLTDPLRKYFNDAGYGFIVAAGRSIELEDAEAGIFRNRNVTYQIFQTADIKGVVVISTTVFSKFHAESAARFLENFGDLPMVCAGVEVPGKDSIILDNARGMSDCLSYLLKSPENQKIAFIGGIETNPDSVQRESVYRSALLNSGSEVDEELIVYSNFLISRSYTLVKDLMTRRPDVDTIVCVNDDSAMGAIQALEAMGLRVPEDVRVSGFDASEAATRFAPSISSVSQPYGEIAAHASNLLLRRLSGEETQPASLTVHTEFVIRESTCTPSQFPSDETVPNGKNERYCEKVADAFIARIRYPRTDISIPYKKLKAALVQAGKGDSVHFEQCVQEYLIFTELSSTDVKWWQNLCAALEDTSRQVPNSQIKKRLQFTIVDQLRSINNKLSSWRTRGEFERYRLQQITQKFLETINKAANVDALSTALDQFSEESGVDRCFFVSYKNISEVSCTRSMVQLARDTNGSSSTRRTVEFNTSELLPKNLKHHLDSGFLVFYPIHASGIQFGYLLMDPGRAESTQFDLLVDSLGGAMLHINQVEVMQRHSTDLEVANKKLSNLANFDKLTNLPNRAYFHHRLNEQLLHAQRDGLEVALMFIDLDGFKLVNDSMGHSAGDALLRLVSDRLKSVLGESALISRLGGDEFTVVIAAQEGISQLVTYIAKELLASLSSPYELAQNAAEVSASIGAALFPKDANSLETLVRNADTAMYHAKNSGKNCFKRYAPELDRELSWRLEQDKNIRRGLENEEFHLVFQPKYRLSDLTMVGAEALLRWNPKDTSITSTNPDEFVPIAEQSGFISKIDNFVLERACNTLSRWMQNGVAIPVAVNVSAAQLHKHEFVDHVAECINDYGISPSLLELEITESAAMENVDLSIQQLTKLQKIGLRTSIDDFGTGYSSLSYLKLLPVNALKIDKTFLQGISADHSIDNPDVAIARAIVALGKAMNFKVIAEGIEHECQRDLMLKMGCHEGQGFYFSKPISENEITELLLANAQAKAA